MPGIYYIRDQMSFTSNNPRYPTKVTFTQKTAAPFRMTTEHAAWALVMMLRRFRQDTTINPRSWLFRAYTWEIWLGDHVIGYVETAVPLVDAKNVTAINNTNTTLNEPQASPTTSWTSVTTSRRSNLRLTGRIASSVPTEKATNETGELLTDTTSEARDVHVSVEFTNRASLYPRDIADVLQFLVTFLMEKSATDPIPFEQQQFHFQDESALTRPVLITFQSGCGGPARPRWWDFAYADLVYGIRQIVLFLLRANRFEFYKAAILSSANQVLGSMEVLPLQALIAGSEGGGNVTMYSAS